MNQAAQQLPSAAESEAAILSIAMNDRRGKLRAQRLLRGEDFYVPANRIIWRHVEELQEIDPIILGDSLRRAGELDKAGGDAVLADLYTRGEGAEHLDFHAEAVRDAALRRELITASADTIQRAYDGEIHAGEIHAKAMARLGRVMAGNTGEPDTGSDVITAIEQLEATMSGETPPRLETRWPDLNRDVPLRRAASVTIAGPTSGGKSIIATNLVADVAKAGGRALLFSFEMTKQDVIYRILSDRANVPPEKFFMADTNKPDPEEMRRIAAAGDWLGKSGVTIYDDATLNVERISAIVQVAHAERPVDLVVVDYVQLVDPTSTNVPREQQISHISRSLRRLAMLTGAVVVGLSQLNDDGQVRESRTIQQDAEVLLQIPEDGSGLYVRKNRNGPRNKMLPIAQRPGRMEMVTITQREAFAWEPIQGGGRSAPWRYC